MANYLAWYGKKREHLIEHERVFVALLQKETEGEQLRKGAETVRLAQVRAMKAGRAQLPPSEKNVGAVADLDREIRFWLALTVDEVIEGYRSGRLRGHRATAVR